MTEPVQRQQIGYDLAGNPMYAASPVFRGSPESPSAAQQATVPLQPIVARPWGAYLGLGCLAVLALVVVGTILVALLIGFSIALMVLAIGMVALVICLLILRDVWRSSRKS